MDHHDRIKCQQDSYKLIHTRIFNPDSRHLNLIMIRKIRRTSFYFRSLSEFLRFLKKCGHDDEITFCPHVFQDLIFSMFHIKLLSSSCCSCYQSWMQVQLSGCLSLVSSLASSLIFIWWSADVISQEQKKNIGYRKCMVLVSSLWWWKQTSWVVDDPGC